MFQLLLNFNDLA